MKDYMQVVKGKKIFAMDLILTRSYGHYGNHTGKVKNTVHLEDVG